MKWLRVSLGQQRLTWSRGYSPWRSRGSLVFVETHPRESLAHHGEVETYTVEVEAPPIAVEAYPGKKCRFTLEQCRLTEEKWRLTLGQRPTLGP